MKEEEKDKIKEKEIKRFLEAIEGDIELNHMKDLIIKETAKQIFDTIFLDSDSNQLEDYDDCVLTYNEFEILKKKWCK